MKATIQTWLDNSSFQWRCMQLHETYDPDNCHDLLDGSLQSFKGQGLLLTGPDLYGKQAAVVQALRLLTPNNYAPVFLDSIDLVPLGSEGAKAHLNALLDRFYEEEKGLCLVLEGMEDCAFRRELLVFLGQTLLQYLHPDFLYPFALILLDDREDTIPAILRSRLRLYRASLPDQQHRREYLVSQSNLENVLSVELFSTLTEGVSYAQLQDLIRSVTALIDSQDLVYLDDDPLTAFLVRQLPPSPVDPVAEQICNAIQHLTEELPKILQAIPQPQIQTAVAAPVNTQTEATPPINLLTDTSSEEQRIRELPPDELIQEIFSPEQIEHLNSLLPIPQ